MRYYLSINGKSFDNVSEIIISRAYRSETAQCNLGGDLLIDRIGAEKTVLSAKVNMLSEEEMNFIRSCRSKMTVNVSYYKGNALENKKMYIGAFQEPSPIYYYGDRRKGIVYGSIALKFTEI